MDHFYKSQYLCSMLWYESHKNAVSVYQNAFNLITNFVIISETVEQLRILSQFNIPGWIPFPQELRIGETKNSRGLQYFHLRKIKPSCKRPVKLNYVPYFNHTCLYVHDSLYQHEPYGTQWAMLFYIKSHTFPYSKALSEKSLTFYGHNCCKLKGWRIAMLWPPNTNTTLMGKPKSILLFLCLNISASF